MKTNSKRWLLFFVCGLCAFVATLSAQNATESKGFLSFAVKVAEENASLFSSPGEESAYTTGRLKAGDILEACFRTENGWCAVRPPEGSFSWINADYVLRNDSDTGTIICPDPSKEVPVRVGADSILKSSDVQVGLENGRRVRILGEQTLTGNKTWLKIAPPRGEFRWIHQSALEQDEFFSQIPGRLTRYEEMLALADPQAYTPDAADLTPPVLSRLDEEKIDPETAPTAIPSDPIQNVSFNNNFNKELTRLYRDLFTAINGSESDEVYDRLSKRALALEPLACDETERAEARAVYEQIQNRRYSPHTSPYGARITPDSRLVDARPIYQSPAVPQNSDSEQVLFSIPQKPAAVPSTVRTEPQATANKPTNKIRFAFAPRDEKAAGNGTSTKRGFFTTKPSTIVPPANYTYPAPTQLKVSPQTETDSPPATKTDQAIDPKVFLAENEPAEEIRQVSALFVKPNIESETSAPTSPAQTETESTTSHLFAFAPTPAGSAELDVTGILGYLPNSKDGAPSYALISKSGNQSTILCYVVPKPGKSLDPYVGKKIAVGGPRGWFKKGTENRKMIVAESIRIY